MNNYEYEATGDYQSLMTHEEGEAKYLFLHKREYGLLHILLKQKGSKSKVPNGCDRARNNLRLVSVPDGCGMWVRDAHLKAALTALSPGSPETVRLQHSDVWEILTRPDRAEMSGTDVARLRDRLLGLLDNDEEEDAEG